MAKQVKHTDAWVYNRHDRRRGTQPPDCICRNPECAADLGVTGMHMYEGGLGYFNGLYTEGEHDGEVILEVLVYSDYSAALYCNECNTEQPHLHLGGYVFNDNAITVAEEFEAECGEATPDVQRRYDNLVLGIR